MIFMLLGLLWKEQWDSRKSSLGLSSWPTTGTIFLLIIQGGPKKSLGCVLEESVCEIRKYFLMESFSLYIHIFSRS